MIDVIPATIVSEHILSSFSMSTILSFQGMQNKLDKYRGKDYMKKFCEYLREYTIKINFFKKKKMKLLTNEQHKSYKNATFCYICKEKFKEKYIKEKKYRKVRTHC